MPGRDLFQPTTATSDLLSLFSTVSPFSQAPQSQQQRSVTAVGRQTGPALTLGIFYRMSADLRGGSGMFCGKAKMEQNMGFYI